MPKNENTTQVDFPQTRCLHELFEAQVERTPDAIAIVFEHQYLSYQALNARANQLAYYLKKQGVKPEVLVGLCVERSIEMIIGLLGILKAGGAYVPLVPTYPKARLSVILSDSQAPVLLTQERWRHQFSEQSLRRILCLDTDWAAIDQESDENLISGVTPDNLAYLIYTSGTTGMPKGVAIEHRSVFNLSNALHQVIYAPHQAKQLRISLNGSLAFDTSVKQIIQLGYGHTLDIIPESIRFDGKALLEYLGKHQIDVLDCTPSQLTLLIEAGLLSQSLLKMVLIGGEPINESTWQALAQTEQIRFYNLYGPTECTVDATICEVHNSIKPVIGHPLSHVQIEILDQNLQRVQAGESGELYIGGSGLARGYFNRPELTAEKFIELPNLKNIKGIARFYKTGDLARYLPDGNIEYLGRIDDQIKLRGYRIELGEIENVLTQHPDIQQAVIRVQEDVLDDKRLVSYVVPKLSRMPTVAGKARYILPNNLAIAHLNRNETDFLYHEIFEEQAYLKHGITIQNGDCIFDVGTNIGLFSLFAHLSANQVKLYGFEPNPFVFEKLELNTALYQVDAKLFNCGLSGETKTANFTFYPKYSFLSGLYAEIDDEKEIVKSFLHNQANSVASQNQDDALLEELLTDKFKSETFEVPLRTLSDIIQENTIEKIDLLKINVEKSEWDVLAGITEDDWQKIHQIALEVHDIDNRLEQVLALFEKQGYHTAVEQDWTLDESTQTNYYLYARKKASHVPLNQHLKAVPTILTSGELRDYLHQQLPDYMVPSAFVMLEALPLTHNGKIDYQALPAPTFSSETETVIPANTQTEKSLVTLWCEVLRLKTVGIEQSFFELGGHSLLATQIISRVRESFQVALPLQDLFDNPTISRLGAQIDSLVATAPTKYETPVNTLGREERYEGKAPLSLNQQSIWLFEQLYPLTPTYHIPLAYELTGQLNLSALEQALTKMQGRHTNLRTTFEVDERGTPQQRIAPPTPITLPVIDLSTVPEFLRAEAIQDTLQAEIRRPFNLGKDRLWRVTILRLAEAEQILLLTFHHLITDGWAIGLFIDELTQAYQDQRLILNKSNSKNALTREELEKIPQYLDFCDWQQHWLQSEAYHSELNYWQSQLQNPSPALGLPTDYLRPPVQTYQGARQNIVISKKLTTALYQLSHQHNATLFMTVLAAFKTLLYRYTGQTDLSVGTAMAGRQDQVWEKVMGLLINTLVLRTTLSGQTPFEAFLNQVRQVSLGAYTHQDLPFQSLVDTLHPDRHLSHHPLFQTFFLLQNFDFPHLNLNSLTTRALNVNTGTVKFDLTLELYEKGEEITGWFEYNTALFSAATIQRMVGHFQTLLESIIAAPKTSLSTLRILTEAERHHLWRSDSHAHPSNAFTEFAKADIEQSIPQRFEQQVKKYPEHIAVQTKHDALTYLKLDGRANQVAQTLLKNAQQGNIALLFEHEISMIVGILGVLKAGLSYIALAPDLPIQRLAYILQDSQARVLLTHNKNWKLAQALKTDILSVINIDDAHPEKIRLFRQSAVLPEAVLPKALSPDTLAYILYTSGSTGQPKGVMQNHRNVLHFIRNYTNKLHINSDDKLTLLSAYSFDAAVMDIFGALLNGATLYPINIKEDSLGYPIKALIQEQGISIYHSTPTVYRHFINTLMGNEAFPKLRLIVLGGEEAYQTDVKLYQQHFSDNAILVNGLGPTESTVSLQYFINKQTSNLQPSVPVGYPVEETEVLLLNEAGEKTELYGEIALSSAYVALGYWQKPEITQTAFWHHDKRRLYRTGDMGRLRADGSLEFVGRKDYQIKLRGYRIELGEIEAILRQHATVHECTVILREDKPGLKQLVAYVVPAFHKKPLEGEWHQFIKEKVPDYMIPASFVMLDAIPLLPNGKLNRQLLPIPKTSQANHSEPKTPLEQQLTQIWEKVLGLSPIGVQNNFFELGGHSLLAITLLSEIEKHFNKRLPLITLFQLPTIAEQATLLNESKPNRAWRALEAIQAQGTYPPLFMMGSTQLARTLLPWLGTNQPVFGINVFGFYPQDNKQHTLHDIQTLAQQCIEEIQTVQPEGPYYIGGYCGDAKAAFEIAQQLHANGQKVALLVLFDGFLELRIKEIQRYSLHQHWLNLLELGPTYLFKKLRDKSIDYFYMIKRQWERLLGKKLNLWTEKMSSTQLDYHSFLKAYRQARMRYIPETYPGSLTLFFASEWRVKESNAFRELATGKIDIYEIPGLHYDLFVMPKIEVLGKQLKACLEKSRAD